MSHQSISTPSAPSAIGPYVQAKVALGSRMVFCSGQIPLDPASGAFVGEGDVSAQTHRVLQNLGAVLEAAGVGFSEVVKTTIFLVDMADFAVVNQVYATYFTGEFPARATVAVAALPRGARVEIEAIAIAA
ncbi:MAG: RidA family protein [Deltaproteobacteria bacterium]|nr:RidA family protein [Deltaproteobacteria bacterium]